MSVECQYCVAICRAATEISQTTTIAQKRSQHSLRQGQLIRITDTSSHRQISWQALFAPPPFCTRKTDSYTTFLTGEDGLSVDRDETVLRRKKKNLGFSGNHRLGGTRT
jgi:hypothetical protein